MVQDYADEIEAALSGFTAARPYSLRKSDGTGITADQLVRSNECYLAGWSIRETAGSVAVVDLYAGPDENAELVGSISLAANASDTQPLPGRGIFCTSGLFVEIVSGTVTGAIWLREPAL